MSEFREGLNKQVAEVMRRTDALEGDESMQLIVSTILDREEDDVLTPERISDYLNAEGVDPLYMNIIAPAIDRCEQVIREWEPPKTPDQMDGHELQEEAARIVGEDKVQEQDLLDLVKRYSD